MSPLARGLSALISAYQAWSGRRPPSCRFEPSCSHYASDAIRTYGALRGVGMAARRILRCRPGGGQGYDPVPDPARTHGAAPRAPREGVASVR